MSKRRQGDEAREKERSSSCTPGELVSYHYTLGCIVYVGVGCVGGLQSYLSDMTTTFAREHFGGCVMNRLREQKKQ